MKKLLTYFSLLVFLAVGVYAACAMSAMPRTYDGRQAAVPAQELLEDPSSYDDSSADGIAAAIVQQNLEKTHAINDVTSIVFDFRGYDTMGEAFILMTAVTGAVVILFAVKEGKRGRIKMKNEDIRIKRVIQRCGCDAILPLALVYIFYIILHGHLSPGGGFQGGVLMVATLLLIYLGHGYAITYQAMRPRLLRKVEGLALAAYILLALLGVALGSRFCENVFYQFGQPGELFSTGTIFLMGTVVGIEVLAGVSALVINMLGVLLGKDVDHRE